MDRKKTNEFVIILIVILLFGFFGFITTLNKKILTEAQRISTEGSATATSGQPVLTAKPAGPGPSSSGPAEVAKGGEIVPAAEVPTFLPTPTPSPVPPEKIIYDLPMKSDLLVQ